jgi:hypothetical protein
MLENAGNNRQWPEIEVFRAGIAAVLVSRDLRVLGRRFRFIVDKTSP